MNNQMDKLIKYSTILLNFKDMYRVEFIDGAICTILACIVICALECALGHLAHPYPTWYVSLSHQSLSTAASYVKDLQLWAIKLIVFFFEY